MEESLPVRFQKKYHKKLKEQRKHQAKDLSMANVNNESHEGKAEEDYLRDEQDRFSEDTPLTIDVNGEFGSKYNLYMGKY